MEIQSQSDELKVCQLQFLKLFNNITIIQKGKPVPVRCVVGNRSRIFKGLENPTRDSTYSLPMIVIQRTGISKNNDRISNINNEIKYRTHSSSLNYNLLPPVPIDISYQVTIVSKYQDHIDKIIGNFIPFFNKDLYVRGFHPKFSDVYYSNQVVMEDGIQEESLDEIGTSLEDVVTCTCNFVFKTYLFCGTEKTKSNGSSIKRKIEEVISGDSIVSVITDTVYDGFIPQINSINVGFYPVPLLSTYEGQFNFVDNLSGDTYEQTVELQRPWVDRLIWKIDENGNYCCVSGQY